MAHFRQLFGNKPLAAFVVQLVFTILAIAALQDLSQAEPDSRRTRLFQDLVAWLS